MKPTIRLLLSFLVLAMFLCTFSACGNQGNVNHKDDIVFTAEDLAGYVFVRSDSSSKSVKTEMMRLRTALIEKCGLDLELITDYCDEDNPEQEKEIIVGNTNRKQSEIAQKGLRCNDFRIVTIDQKIVIAAGSDEVLVSAIDYFIEHIINSKQKSLRVPDGGYDDFAEYRFDQILVDGVDITEFELYSSNKELVEKVNEGMMFDILGHSLKTSYTVDLNDKSRHYIIIEATDLHENEYGVNVKDGNIVIHGSYNTVDEAADYFCNELLKKNGEARLQLTGANSIMLSEPRKKTYTKQQLLSVLNEVQNDSDHIIVGEETYTGNPISSTIQLFSNATGGHTPSIIGVDIRILPKTPEAMSQWICEFTDYCANGGMLSVCSSFANPSGNISTTRTTGVVNTASFGGVLGYQHTEAGYQKAFTDLITDGTDLNLAFREELDRDAEFFKKLQENGVVIMYRPFHELNSSSFWWCIQQMNDTIVTVDPDCIINLWRYVHDYFTKQKGLDNLLFCYSVANWNGAYAEDCYPGDAYVDISGVDWYTESKGDLQTFGNIQNVSSNKIHAICEFGPNGEGRVVEDVKDRGKFYNGSDMLADLKQQKRTKKIAYVMTWSSPWNIDSMGSGDKLMESSFTLDQKDVAKLFEKYATS